MKKIKVENPNKYTVAVPLITQNGLIHKELKPKKDGRVNYVKVTEEQFEHIYQTTKMFKRGHLIFNVAELSDELKDDLGIFIDVEDEEEVLGEEFKLNKTDEEISKILKGQMGTFKKFMSDISSDDVQFTFKQRVFDLAYAIEDFNRTKQKAVEAATGMKFDNIDDLNATE